MEPKPNLQDTLARWKAQNPDAFWPRTIRGYRACRYPDCPTQIEESQTRLHCYYHGGQPTIRRRSTYRVDELDRINAAELRRRIQGDSWRD